MTLTNLVLDKISPNAAIVATVAPPAIAAATWVGYVDALVRIGAGLAAIIASVFMAWYWRSKRHREEKYTENESGL